jgi:hypothetical protein
VVEKAKVDGGAGLQHRGEEECFIRLHTGAFNERLTGSEKQEG